MMQARIHQVKHQKKKKNNYQIYMKNMLLIISILLNIGLFSLYYLKTEAIKTRTSEITTRDIDTTDYEITSMKNFESVYFDRNDTLYKDLWGEAFENQPQSAFLISSSYYYVTKDKRILEDIAVSISQLESMYPRKKIMIK